MEKKKKKKINYIDDGHTIYNMDIDGMPHRKINNKKDDFYLTKKEKNVAIKAALAHYLPIVFGVLVCFLLAMLIIYFWLQ